MLRAMLSIVVVTATGSGQAQPVQSKNGEFIFRQYPPRAKAAGEQGAVRFQAEVDAKGNVMSCKVTATSGYRRLDDETCEMIVDHASFKPTLDSEGKAREAMHDGVVNWRLPGNTPLAKPQLASTEAPDKVICKRSLKTGSLVASSRLCMTAREWSQRAEKNQEEIEYYRKGHTSEGMQFLPPGG